MPDAEASRPELSSEMNPAAPPVPEVKPSAGKGQTARGATLLLMASNLLSALLGLARTKYIAHAFGAGMATDAYNAAFTLPDMLGYFLVGGVGSATLVTMLTRFRERNDPEGEDRTLSVVLNAMLIVLVVAVLLAELFAPMYTHAFFPKFDAQTAALCTRLTRLLLPAQIFFFAGGALGARLLARKIFVYQSLSPLIYNASIIAGAVLFSHRYGVYSLPIGVLAGVVLGPGLLITWAAFRTGLNYSPVFNLRHPAFREWLRLNLPLMLGFTVGMADKWILNYFASADMGGISRLTVAKNLFNSPLTIIGGAAGAASLPFFASLHAQGRTKDFSGAVSRAVSRLMAAGAVVSAWMIALSPWLLDLFRGGVFKHNDAAQTAQYFAIFAITLGLWSAQGIYARAFYAAGNAKTPLIAGSILTLCSLPVYKLLFVSMGTKGLAIASDLSMLAYTVLLAILLQQKKLVRIADLDFAELMRAAAAGVAAWAAAWFVAHRLPVAQGHEGDLITLAVGSVVWMAVVAAILFATGSSLPKQMLRRKSA